jgi:hypothetical protein
VSFDCEFTGLRGNDTREEWEDTPEERYSKLRDGCSEFSLIQYGICLFVKQENEYEVFPFNFYLFPCHSLGRRLDRCFRCQVCALIFMKLRNVSPGGLCSLKGVICEFFVVVICITYCN